MKADANNTSHNYLLDRQDEYSDMMFGPQDIRLTKYSNIVFDNNTSTNQASVPTQHPTPHPSVYGFALETITEFNNTFENFIVKPYFMVPQYVQQAYNSFRTGSIINGLNASAGAVLGATTLLPVGEIYSRGTRLVESAALNVSKGLGVFGKTVWGGVESRASRWGLFGKQTLSEKTLLKTPRYTDLVSGVTKSEARSLLNEGSLPISEAQTKAILKQLKSGRMDSINIKKMNNGQIHLSVERSGYTSGFQRMSFKINENGTNLRIVQTAFDNERNIIHQMPGYSKNNLYDVKL